MDLKQLEYFVRVAELGSFTRASIELDIAQPALSRQVRLLEVELHQNLLIRNGRGVTTTDAGKLLLEHSRGVLHQVERAREALTLARGALTGRVALGLPPSLTRVLTVPLIRTFRARLPEARLSISEGLSAAMQEALVNGRLDIALLYNAAPSSDVDTVPLVDEDLFLVEARRGAAATAPITVRELASVPLVIPSRNNAMRLLVETELAAQGLHPLIALEIDSIAAILDLVADEAGGAVLTKNAVTSLGRPGAFVMRPIVEPNLYSRLSLATSSRRPATPAQREMLELIRHITAELLLSA